MKSIIPAATLCNMLTFRMIIYAVSLIIAASCFTPAIAGSKLESHVDGAPTVARGTRIAGLRLATNFYATPSAPYICGPDESVVRVTLGTSDGEQAQSLLDAARAKSPEAVLRVTIAGTISIAKTPLLFGSRTCVFFQPGARIIALTSCSAPALVRIQDAELISLSSAESADGISRGEIDGAGLEIIGIHVVNSGKVHLDELALRNCGGGGVVVAGRGANRYADPVSLTRSTISGCAGCGLTVRNSAQFIALDDVVTRNGGGMDVDSSSAILANNICAGNRTGMIVSGKDGTISRNQIIANVTGLRLSGSSDYTLVSENTLQDNQLGAEIFGSKATVESNIFANDREVVTGGKDNLLESNRGLTAADVTSPGCAYFRPPTISDPHSDTVVWKGLGGIPMEREDLTIASSKDPMPDTEVTQRLMAARMTHPKKVLVVKLVGQFTITTTNGIRLPNDTCVLLDGCITNDQKEPAEQMVLMAGNGCGSFSGGSLVSRSKVTHGLSGAKGNSRLLIERVEINLGSLNGHQGTQSFNGINTKQHAGPVVIRGCDISNPGARGVWIHVTSRVYVLSSRFHGGGMTIDFDAFGNHCSALYNTLTENSYHSTIFIEEGVKYTTVFSNHCMSNDANAITIHCQEASGPTADNTVACNVMEGNSKTNGGANLGFSGASQEKNSADNYAFNNRLTCNHNSRRGAINIKVYSTGNYIAQSVIEDCSQMVSNWSTRPACYAFTGSIGFTAPQP